MYLHSNPDLVPKVGVRHIVKTYWQNMKPYRFLFFVTCIAVVVRNSIDVVMPTYWKQIFDQSNAHLGTDAFGILAHILLVILALRLTGWAFSRFAMFTMSYFEAHAMADLKSVGFDYLMEHSHTFFANNFVGSLQQRVNKFARAYEILIDRLIMDVIPLLVQIVGVIIVVWPISHSIVYGILTLVVVFIFINYNVAKYKQPFDIASSEADSRTSGALSDAITNQTAVRLFSGFLFEQKKFREVAKDQADKTWTKWKIGATADTVQSIVVVFAEFGIMYYAIKLLALGTITIGTIVLIQAYMMSLIMKLWDFARVIRHVYEAYSDAKEMIEILETPYEVADAPNAKALVPTNGEITFQNVSFRFHETKKVFDDLSVTVVPGERVALVGHSGAGKSTFVRLLLRAYDVSSGAIFIDGQNIHEITQESLHNAIAFVPQEPALFHRSLLENIRYGRRDATDAEVYEAARLAHCAEFIESLPEGYATKVGERGVKLSGGERQRVAIARAILKNAPILILDEATSALDSHSEHLIQDALHTLMQGKTVLVIAHRLSTIRSVDRIIVFKDGGVAEQGTHDELVAQKGSVYGSLWEMQAGGFIEE